MLDVKRRNEAIRTGAIMRIPKNSDYMMAGKEGNPPASGSILPESFAGYPKTLADTTPEMDLHLRRVNLQR
jgi:hypothetical protein